MSIEDTQPRTYWVTWRGTLDANQATLLARCLYVVHPDRVIDPTIARCTDSGMTEATFGVWAEEPLIAGGISAVIVGMLGLGVDMEFVSVEFDPAKA